MTARSIRGAVCLAAAGLAVAAAPALATEGPPPGGPGGPGGGGGGGGVQPLPNTLAPVTIPQRLGPSVQPAPRTKRAKRPRITKFNMTRRIRAHRHPHLRLGVATPGTVRVVIERRGGKKAKRVWSRTVAARRTAVSVHLPARLRAGRYRVTVVSVDAQGQSSRPVRRALVVVHS